MSVVWLIDTKIEFENLKVPVTEKSSACVYLCKFNYEDGRPSTLCGCGKSLSNSSSCQPFRCVPRRENANDGSGDADRLTTAAQSRSRTLGRGVNPEGRRITTPTTSVRTPTGGPLIPTIGKETVEVQTSTEEPPLQSEERDGLNGNLRALWRYFLSLTFNNMEGSREVSEIVEEPPLESEERDVDLEGSGDVSEIGEDEGSANGEEESKLARQSDEDHPQMDGKTSTGRQRTRREPSYRAMFAREIAEGQFIKQVYGKECDCSCLNFTCNCADSVKDEHKCRELPTWICRPGTVNRMGMHSVFTSRSLFNQPSGAALEESIWGEDKKVDEFF